MTIVNTEHGHTVEFNQEKHVYIHNNEYIVGTSTILGKLANLPSIVLVPTMYSLL